jgi:hypothetical protein
MKKISIIFVLSLFLVGCTGMILKPFIKDQQGIAGIITEKNEFIPLTDINYKGTLLKELSPDLIKVADKEEGKNISRYIPTSSEDDIIVVRNEVPYQLKKFQNVDEKELKNSFPKGTTISSLFIKSLRSGKYTRLIPEGYSINTPLPPEYEYYYRYDGKLYLRNSRWGVSPDGKFLVYAIYPDYKLYIQPLFGKEPRKMISEQSLPFLLSEKEKQIANNIYGLKGKDILPPPFFKFSSGGKYLAYFDNNKGLCVLSLTNPQKEPKVISSFKSDKSFNEKLFFTCNERFLYYQIQQNINGMVYIEDYIYDLELDKNYLLSDFISIDQVKKEMERGRSFGGALLDSLTGTTVEDRTYELCDISCDGKYALFTIYTQNKQTHSNLSSVPGGYYYQTTKTRIWWSPEKNIIVDLKSGDVRRLFGVRGFDYAIERPYFLVDNKIVYEDWNRYYGNRLEFALYDFASLSKIFETQEKEVEKLIKSSRINFGKEFDKREYKNVYISNDGKWIAWQWKDDVFCYCQISDCKVNKITGYGFAFSPDSKFIYYYTKEKEIFRMKL